MLHQVELKQYSFFKPNDQNQHLVTKIYELRDQIEKPQLRQCQTTFFKPSNSQTKETHDKKN